jgi:hypothetical protein
MDWRRPVAAGLCLSLAACASSPDSISARYVSPATYQTWSCEQLFEEKRRIHAEVARVADLQRENANADAVLLTVGVIIFWPALIGMAATKDRKEDLSRLKGEFEAVDQTLRQKQCSLSPPSATGPAVVPTAPAKPAPAAVRRGPAAKPAAVPAADPQLVGAWNSGSSFPGNWVEFQIERVEGGIAYGKIEGSSAQGKFSFALGADKSPGLSSLSGNAAARAANKGLRIELPTGGEYELTLDGRVLRGTYAAAAGANRQQVEFAKVR